MKVKVINAESPDMYGQMGLNEGITVGGVYDSLYDGFLFTPGVTPVDIINDDGEMDVLMPNQYVVVEGRKY